jgi:hypothetical protein
MTAAARCLSAAARAAGGARSAWTPGVGRSCGPAGVIMMEASNVLFHAGMAVRERRYNPGVVTATVLMVPHAAAGARWLARSGRLSRRQGLLASAIGVAFAGVPLAMKIRMRRASRLSPDG